MAQKSKNKFVVRCSLFDLNFVLENYEQLASESVREFGLPDDTVVKIHPHAECEKGRLSTFFNGEPFGDILIKDEPEEEEEEAVQAPEPKKKRAPAPDRGLH